MITKTKQRVIIEAVITKADGSVINLGVLHAPKFRDKIKGVFKWLM